MAKRYTKFNTISVDPESNFTYLDQQITSVFLSQMSSADEYLTPVHPNTVFMMVKYVKEDLIKYINSRTIFKKENTISCKKLKSLGD